MKYNNSTPRLCMLEAVEGYGVRIMPLYQYLKKTFWPHGAKMWWQGCNNSSINQDAVFDFAFQRWSDEYVTSRQFIVAMNYRLRNLLGMQLELDKEKWHCSKLVTEAYKSQGYRTEKPSILTTPGDVTRFSCLTSPVLLEESD